MLHLGTIKTDWLVITLYSFKTFWIRTPMNFHQVYNLPYRAHLIQRPVIWNGPTPSLHNWLHILLEELQQILRQTSHLQFLPQLYSLYLEQPSPTGSSMFFDCLHQQPSRKLIVVTLFIIMLNKFYESGIKMCKPTITRNTNKHRIFV